MPDAAPSRKVEYRVICGDGAGRPKGIDSRETCETVARALDEGCSRCGGPHRVQFREHITTGWSRGDTVEKGSS